MIIFIVGFLLTISSLIYHMIIGLHEDLWWHIAWTVTGLVCTVVGILTTTW